MNNTEAARIRMSIETHIWQKNSNLAFAGISLIIFQGVLLYWIQFYPLMPLEFQVIVKLVIALLTITGAFRRLQKYKRDKSQLIKILRESTSEADFWDNEKVGEIMYSTN